MSALDDVVREGKVRFVGLSNFKLEEIEACMAVRRVDVVQYGWNMFDRRMQHGDPSVLRRARRRLHGVRLARVRTAHRRRSPRTTTSAAPTGGPARATWARSRCSPRCSAPRSSRTTCAPWRSSRASPRGTTRALPQLALRWAISHPAVSTALVGCRTVAEVEDNAGAIGWSISDADLAEIDAIFARHGIDTVPDFWIEEV